MECFHNHDKSSFAGICVDIASLIMSTFNFSLWIIMPGIRGSGQTFFGYEENAFRWKRDWTKLRADTAASNRSLQGRSFGIACSEVTHPWMGGEFPWVFLFLSEPLLNVNQGANLLIVCYILGQKGSGTYLVHIA